MVTTSGGFPVSGTGANLMEVSAFMAERLDAQLERTEAKLNAQRQEYEAKQRDSEAKLDAQRQMNETQRQKYEAKIRDLEAKLRDCEARLDTQHQRQEDIQLARLQERLDALHQAKLLTDDETFALEDKVVDFIECRSSATVESAEMGASAESTVRKLVSICEGVSKDAMLARQLRRKFL